MEQLYRRALFNVLVGNRDDHLRNHGLLRARSGWTLAPAFDLNPEVDRLEHALALDEFDHRPRTASLRSTAAFYRLSPARAAQIEDEVRVGLAGWRGVAESIGLVAHDVRLLERVILPPES